MERQIEELKVDNRSPAKRYRQVRSTNPVEEAFDDSMSSVKEEIMRRKYDTARKNQSMKISKSQPDVLARKDISIQAGETVAPDIAGLNEFTDTDKMYRDNMRL